MTARSGSWAGSTPPSPTTSSPCATRFTTTRSTTTRFTTTRRARTARRARAPRQVLPSWAVRSGLLAGAGLLATALPLLAGLLGPGLVPLPARSAEALFQLIEQKRCPKCDLADADLVHAQLSDADLRGARLQRANLGQARLDGARLAGADLSFTSLVGASLRGADLQGARLEGTDLRQADLSGALLDQGALSRAHWQGARGIDHRQLSYGELHNAGVEAARQGRMPEAEQWFSAAIRREPAAAVSWVARAITRGELGRRELAASDFDYAASLYTAGGETAQAEQLRKAAKQMGSDPDRPAGASGNGLGLTALSGALSAMQFLAPLAAKAFLPLPF